VQVTYLLHLCVVFVLTMVQSWPHHLRHQWSQISTFLFLNHIHHHTYFKSSYVQIQVFHILHHHTMKLLLAFKSFLPRRLNVEIGSENWFAAGCLIWQRELFRCRQPIRQRELVRCRLPISAARTGSLQAANSTVRTSSLQAAQFSSENCFAAWSQQGSHNCFAAGATISAANANS
jgi:hypothetical protein